MIFPSSWKLKAIVASLVQPSLARESEQVRFPLASLGCKLLIMYLKSIELVGFKSFGKKTELVFGSPIVAVVGPNGSGKSNVAEAFRFVLGEQSMKSMRSKKGEDLIWG